MNVAAYVLLIVAGFIYFRAMVTTTRDFTLWRSMVGYGTPVGPADANFYEHLCKIGPLPFWDIRVVVLVALVLCPFVLERTLGNSWAYGPILCVAVGSYLAPLTAPTIVEPEPDDLFGFGKFIGKWLGGKLDIYLKITAAGGAIWLVSKIPAVGKIPEMIGSTIFPVIKKTGIERELFDVAAPILVVLLLTRVSMFAAHAKWYAGFVLLSAGWIWIQFQWLLVAVLDDGHHSALNQFEHWKLLIFASDFLSLLMAIVGLLIQRRRQVRARAERSRYP
ncbi:hypothetical protein [Bradyrhizobium neotropicale]|uniref:hypothetical protein n=1 Tax=Bradyrhizobium neotropicale TaxID=1497615 RepID=UPI001AD655DA|nr:hypothetical protein [Bradyrhizobium neotropicale]MBO4226636.1 hypothetical protein [Bradyrhizobium neotropicale]